MSIHCHSTCQPYCGCSSPFISAVTSSVIVRYMHICFNIQNSELRIIYLTLSIHNFVAVTAQHKHSQRSHSDPELDHTFFYNREICQTCQLTRVCRYSRLSFEILAHHNITYSSTLYYNQINQINYHYNNY